MSIFEYLFVVFKPGFYLSNFNLTNNITRESITQDVVQLNGLNYANWVSNGCIIKSKKYINFETCHY